MLYTPRSEAPSQSNKYYIGKSFGGYSPCLVINKSNGFTLANCVGYALGRFNEINDSGWRYFISTDAQYVWYNAPSVLEKGQIPKLGALMCWSTNSSGYGHVAIVEKIEKEGSTYKLTTSESAYGGSVFYTKIRKSSELNYGYGGSFQGFIYQPKSYEAKTTSYDIPMSDVKSISITSAKIHIDLK